MLRTITIGNSISVQGVFVEEISADQIAVNVFGKIFKGKPVLGRKEAPERES